MCQGHTRRTNNARHRTPIHVRLEHPMGWTIFMGCAWHEWQCNIKQKEKKEGPRTNRNKRISYALESSNETYYKTIVRRTKVFAKVAASGKMDWLHKQNRFPPPIFRILHSSLRREQKRWNDCCVFIELFRKMNGNYRVKSLTSRKEIRPSPSSSTSCIIAFKPRCVCGAPKTSIIRFSSGKSRNPSWPSSNLQTIVPLDKNVRPYQCNQTRGGKSKDTFPFLDKIYLGRRFHQRASCSQ